MRRRQLLARLAGGAALLATGGSALAQRLGYTLVQSADGRWFANVRGALFLIRPDGLIGSDSAAQATFRFMTGG